MTPTGCAAKSKPPVPRPTFCRWCIGAENRASARCSTACNRIERLFNRIKHFRRLATRYEKHASNFLAMLRLAATHLWLRIMSL